MVNFYYNYGWYYIYGFYYICGCLRGNLRLSLATQCKPLHKFYLRLLAGPFGQGLKPKKIPLGAWTCRIDGYRENQFPAPGGVLAGTVGINRFYIYHAQFCKLFCQDHGFDPPLGFH